MTGPVPAHRGRRDNGLNSDEFSPVADVDPRLADHLLDVLGLREVAAYVEPAPVSTPVTVDRLYVAADQTVQAREVLTELASELGIEVAAGHDDRLDAPLDPLRGRDTDAEFAAIVAGLEELDRPLFDPESSPQVISASATDEVEHFVPPPAPPLPRPAAATATAAFVTLLGILVIAFGSAMGLPTDLQLPLGVVLVLFGAGLLILRLRPDPRDDSDDDGAVL
jgi:hypothetical protein